KGLPLELRGVYVVQDADRGLSLLTELQGYQMEATGAFLPGCGVNGKFQQVVRKGATVHEVRLDLEHAEPAMRSMMQKMYGDELRFQAPKLSPHHIGFSMSSRPDAVTTLIGKKGAIESLGQNPVIRHIAAKLPPSPHIMAVVDVGQIL